MSMLLQFRHTVDRPSMEEVCRMFHVDASAFDQSYGVVTIDAAAHLYTVLVTDDAISKIQAALEGRVHDPAEGLFANPRIEPFGPPVS